MIGKRGRIRSIASSLDPITAHVEEQLGEYRQGDIIKGVRSITIGIGKRAQRISTPDGVVIITQTCDIVRCERSQSVQIARITQVQGNDLRDSKRRRSPRYVWLPHSGLSDAGTADLDMVATIAKTELVHYQRESSLDGDKAVRRFARSVAHHYGRFAFPDEVHPWFSPLTNLMERRNGKASPEGKLITELVREIRASCKEGWDQPGRRITLTFILKKGALGSLVTSPSEMDSALSDDLPTVPIKAKEMIDSSRNFDDPKLASASLAKSILDVRQGILSGNTDTPVDDAATLEYLWNEIATIWSTLCRPSVTERKVEEAVTNLTGQAVEERDFSIADYWESEPLDLDYLSIS